MRIIQICSGTDSLRRGAERFCLQLTVSLAASGHNVTLIHGDQDPLLSQKIPVKSMAIPEATNRLARKAGLDYFNPRSLLALARLINIIKPDIIHFHSIYGLSTASVYFSSRHCPVLVTLHDSWLAFSDAGIITPRFNLANSYTKVPLGFAHRQINRFFLKDATLVSPSLWMKKFFESAVFQSPIHIPNGIDPKRPQTSSENIVLWVGKLTIFKGLPSIIGAVTDIINRAGWRFIVVGDGPCKRELETSFPSVEFVGYCDPEQYYKRASLLIVSSIGYENFPTVILEGMRHGICVIGHGIGGISELIRNNEIGILYHSIDSLTQKLLTIISNRDKLLRLGSAAKKEFDEKYQWNTCYNRYLKLYNSLVDC